MRAPFSLLLPLYALILSGCSGERIKLEREQRELEQKLEALGEPVPSQTVPMIGAMTLPNFSRPGTADKTATGAPKWMQVDLAESVDFNAVVLIPVQMDWHRLMHPTYNFPSRFRVDLSDDPEFKTSLPLGVFTEEDFPNPGLSPVMLPSNGKKGRYVRITVFGVDTFALAELMVLKGKRNIAIGCSVSSSGLLVSEPLRWDMTYLVDGWTPLGPPILDEPLEFDGQFAGPPTISGGPVWMEVDLGKSLPIQEVRLYAVHGRSGVDLPGYRFPEWFRIETSSDRSTWKVLFETTDKPFPNPGNNVVTIPAAKTTGRYVRIGLITEWIPFERQRFGLSEFQVYANGENVALGANVDSSNDPSPVRTGWPKNLLVDGNTSFGRILELPDWINNWTQRRELHASQENLGRRQQALLAETERRQWILFGSLGPLFAGAVLGVFLYTRKVRTRELDRFRRGLTQDLHDEVGSNLAGIGMISLEGMNTKHPLGADAWAEIYRVSKETTDAMRETLWLAGGRVETNLNLMEHLRLTATRMLPGLSVYWKSTVESFPQSMTQEARREIFLFFKETLANVVRHSQATTVELSLSLEEGQLTLEIRDNGQGFSLRKDTAGIGLGSLQERAKRLGGVMEIQSQAGKGTHVVLRMRGLQ